MDDAKKKKLVLALVAVAALGAGAYFTGFLGGDSGPKKQATNTGPVVRKEGKVKEEAKVTRKEGPKAAPVEKEEVVRKEREEETAASVERKKKRSEKKDEKKKVIAPAA